MRRKGFALIELLIVIVTIGILAVIVVPQLFDAARRGREADLRLKLHDLRDAMKLFELHCEDAPAQLDDILLTEPPEKGGNGMAINPAAFQGPYLASLTGGLPVNPITGGNTVGEDWTYDAKTGSVNAASGIARDGTNYSTW